MARIIIATRGSATVLRKNTFHSPKSKKSAPHVTVTENYKTSYTKEDDTFRCY
jgi:hypothetical protein